MSKNNVSLASPTPTPNAHIIYEWEISDLEGRLLTLVESLGLPDKQENALKGLVRQSIWQIVSTYERRVPNFEIIESVIEGNRKRNAERSPN